MKQEKTIVKEEWIKEYIQNKGAVSVVDGEFVDHYIDKFNPSHYIQPFGANTCRELGRMLSSLYKCNVLDRHRFSIHELGDNYANWVYMYELRE